MNDQELKRLLKVVRQFSGSTEKKIVGYIAALDRDAAALQRRLLEQLLSDFVPQLDTLRGVLVFNNTNLLRLAQLDRLLDDFGRALLTPRIREFGAELLTLATESGAYFEAMGLATTRTAALTEAVTTIRTMIGMDAAGNLTTNGYLYRLGKTEEMRGTLRDYVTRSLAGKTPLRQYTQGLSEIVKGNSDTDGALQRYLRQNAYDTYNQTQEAANRLIADELKLQYFMYEGSVIDTTRDFCRKRAGKVFSVAEAATWKNDADLLGDPNTYNALIERGRWNCRHMIRYIPEELAFYLRPELKK